METYRSVLFGILWFATVVLAYCIGNLKGILLGLRIGGWKADWLTGRMVRIKEEQD